MRAIELNLESVLFSATVDKISITGIQSIERSGGGIKIKLAYSSYLECNIGDAVIEDKYKTYYLELEHAQKAQLKARQNEIQIKYAEMLKKQSEYNEMIDLWFNKPAHDPFEKVIEEV